MHFKMGHHLTNHSTSQHRAHSKKWQKVQKVNTQTKTHTGNKTASKV